MYAWNKKKGKKVRSLKRIHIKYLNFQHTWLEWIVLLCNKIHWNQCNPILLTLSFNLIHLVLYDFSFFVLIFLYVVWTMMQSPDVHQAYMWCWGFLCTNLSVVFFFYADIVHKKKMHQLVKTYIHHHNTSIKLLKWMKLLCIWICSINYMISIITFDTWNHHYDMHLGFPLDIS